MATKFDVRAKLILDARNADQGAKRASSSVGKLDQNIRKATASSGALVAKLAGVAGAYVGLNAVSRAFGSLIRDAESYTRSLESTQIGLTSVIGAVQGTDWETAGKRASAAFEAVKDASITSPATPQEMFGVFQGILGPIQNAGFGMQKVLDITKSTVLASSALGVDFEQARRDISLMTRGAAGMDVKLFSLLRATGAIKEDTANWNKNLTAQERVEKLEKALAKFAKSGEAFGKSWGGITSTFKGIRQELTRAAFQPVLNVLAANLLRFNTLLINNRQEVTAYFQAFGNVVAGNLQKMINRSVVLFQTIQNNWGAIIEKTNTAVNALKQLGPVLGILGGAMVAGKAMGGMSLGDLGARITKGARGRDEKGRFTAGKTKSTGGIAMAMLNPFALLLGAGGLAGLKAAIVGLVASIGPVILVVGLLAGVFMAVQQHWEVLTQVFTVTTSGMMDEVMALGRAIWSFLRPVLKAIGQVWLALLVLGFKLLIPVLRLVIKALTWAWSWMGKFAKAVEDKLQPVFDWLFQLFAKLSKWIMDKFSAIGRWMDQNMPEGYGAEDTYKTKIEKKDDGGFFEEFRKALDESRAKQASKLSLGDIPGARTGRPDINYHMEGSRFNIKQEFGDQHSPDKIVRVMMQDLTRQAESRISSGHAPALSR